MTMITIYCYDRIAGAENSLTYMAAARQPIAGGCTAEESARIIVPVHQVETVEQARIWIRAQLAALPMSYVLGVTRPAYTIREVPHSQALLCITAQGAIEDDDC